MTLARKNKRGAWPCGPAAALALAVWLTACGGGPAKVRVKAAGAGEREVPAKSGYTYPVTKTFTSIDGKMTTAASYRVFVASFDLDASGKGRTLSGPLTADDQVRIEFSLVGDEGGKEDAPLKAGDYTAKADKFRKVEDVSVTTYGGGKVNKVTFDRGATAGTVKVGSVSGDTVTGEIDLTSGENSVKGPFTAKVIRL